MKCFGLILCVAEIRPQIWEIYTSCILPVEEKQNLHTILFLFNLLFIFKCENIIYLHLFHYKGVHDSFTFHKEAEKL